MNQILVTEKLYITPELKRKKKIYKIDFFLSILLIIILLSMYLFSVHGMNKSEAISRELLSDPKTEVVEQEEIAKDDTVINDNVLVIYLNVDGNVNVPEEQESNATAETAESVEQRQEGQTITASNGDSYTKVAQIKISKINVNYAVLSETTDALLKISPCYFWGPNPNEVGNFCIVGHNYRNKKFFSKVPTLEMGDIVELTDMTGRTLKYKVYDKYTVDPTDVRCTSQLTSGKKEVTLITCTDDSSQRVVVKATQA